MTISLKYNFMQFIFLFLTTSNMLLISSGVYCQRENKFDGNNIGFVRDGLGIWSSNRVDKTQANESHGAGNANPNNDTNKSLMRDGGSSFVDDYMDKVGYDERDDNDDNDHERSRGNDVWTRNENRYRMQDGADEWRAEAEKAETVAWNWNCSRCEDDKMAALKRDLIAEIKERKSLETTLNAYVTELYDLRGQLQQFNARVAPGIFSLPLTAKGFVSFSAKLSYNRELKPLDTVVFDNILSNEGQGYDANTGIFTAPLPGTYMFFCTILSGYNTKVETAIIANDQEITRIYSGAHDAHGSGSNMAVLDLHSNEVVWVRLLYQGGNHVHGYYSTFSGVLLNEKIED